MRTRGFTLIELIIAIGLIGLIATFGLLLSFDFYRGYAFLSEQRIAVSVLQKARSQSLNNIDEKMHGVHFETNKYVLFDGDFSSSTNKEDIKLQLTMFIKDPLPADIIFDQLSGESADTSFTLSNGSKDVVISVKDNGRIDVQ